MVTLGYSRAFSRTRLDARHALAHRPAPLQRQPSAEEAKTLSTLLNKQLADYQKDTAAAEALLKKGAAPIAANLNKSELAAWTHVARVLLNLHETITRS